MLLTLGLVGTAVSVVLWFTAVTLIIQPVLMSLWAAGVYTELTIDSRPGAVVAMVFGDAGVRARGLPHTGRLRRAAGAVARVPGGGAAGGTVIDPEVVVQLLSRRRRGAPLSPREREVPALMAEGRSNTAIAARPVVTEGVVEKHISGIFAKPALGPAPEDHRRVPAVLTDLGRRRECAMAWDGWTIWHTGS